MEEPINGFVKILFRYYSNALEQITVETMLASIIDLDKGYFRIENIPFYGPPVSSGDIVKAEFEETEEMFTFRSTVEYSGNSTIQIIVMNQEQDIEDIRGLFDKLGCVSEKMNFRFFAMEVSEGTSYGPVKAQLNELKAIGKIDYAEPCLSEKHQREVE